LLALAGACWRLLALAGACSSVIIGDINYADFSGFSKPFLVFSTIFLVLFGTRLPGPIFFFGNRFLGTT
jgi:hypothetical protein